MALQAKIVYAGSNNTSYEQAERDLAELAELKVDDKQVRRLCKHIGAERCGERDAAAAAYQALPLVERKEVPKGVTAPELAVVGVDGGRLQIFERSAAADPPANSEARSDAGPAGDDSEEREDNGRHWREDKIGLLMTMNSSVRGSDPCPEIPETFVNPLRILKLAREFKKRVPAEEEAAQSSPDPAADQQACTDATTWEPPEVQAKRLLASRRPWDSFGPPAGSPRQAVTRAFEYLRNNRERMHYAEYRQQGLPITSSYVESAVKQFNYRVKGTEKFWTEHGAEEMLQLRADLLSDDKPLAAFWKRRETGESGQRRYRKAA